MAGQKTCPNTHCYPINGPYSRSLSYLPAEPSSHIVLGQLVKLRELRRDSRYRGTIADGAGGPGRLDKRYHDAEMLMYAVAVRYICLCGMPVNQKMEKAGTDRCGKQKRWEILPASD